MRAGIHELSQRTTFTLKKENECFDYVFTSIRYIICVENALSTTANQDCLLLSINPSSPPPNDATVIE